MASASAWYDPDLNRRPGDLATRKWSTEMLYRSWATMHDIAGYPYDDWWDLPYQSLVGNTPGWARAKASLHQQRDRAGLNANSAAQEAARAVLAGFRADFGNILRGARGAAPQTAAQEMIEDKNWLAVPDGRFKMGAPRDKQGFPPKVKAYWVRDLDDVQTGRMTADAVARRSTKTEWFTGAQAKQLREGDILWLSEAFSVAEPAPGAKRLARPKRDAAAYRRALQILEDKWSRRDETPAENPQQVATFVMLWLPVLHRWYHLFAPGYRAAVAKYLQPRPHPPDNHPAILCRPVDAWAFCQWANWMVEDATAEGGRRRYGLRLPHEAEWEYAVRWATNGSGRARPSPMASAIGGATRSTTTKISTTRCRRSRSANPTKMLTPRALQARPARRTMRRRTASASTTSSATSGNGRRTSTRPGARARTRATMLTREAERPAAGQLPAHDARRTLVLP